MNSRVLLLVVSSVGFASVASPPAEIDALFAELARYESGHNAEPLRRLEQRLRESDPASEQRCRLERGLVQLLSPSATYETRYFACQQLAIYGTEASLEALAELLATPDGAAMACLALSTHPSAEAGTVLRDALARATGADRVQILVALADRRDASSVPALKTLAHDPDSATALAAIAALGRIANDESLKLLASLRQSSDPERAQAAVWASLVAADTSVEAGDVRAATGVYEGLLAPSQPGHVRRAALEGLLRADADGGRRRILDVLSGQDAALRPSAIARIVDLTGAEVSRDFARELPRLHPSDRVLLIEALAARNDPDARAAITEQVSARDVMVRDAAIAALARIGDASTAAVLLDMLRAAGRADDQRVFAGALSDLAPDEAVDEAIIASLKNAPAATRVLLIDALRRRACTSAVPALLDQAAAREGDVAERAFRALGDLAPPERAATVVERLVDLQVPSARSAAETAAARVLAKVPDPADRSAIVLGRLTASQDLQTRSSLIRLLRVCADGRALQALQAAVGDAEPAIRDAALRTLADWPDTAAWDPLMQVYRQGVDLREHRLVLGGLVRLARTENPAPSDALVGRYRELLEHARDDVELRLILGAIADCAHPDALAVVLPLRTHDQVGSEAQLAIRRIAQVIRDKHPEAANEALRQLE